MKAKKCPYCGKRVSYLTIFSERKQSEHICRRCGKESKIIIKKSIYLYFLLAVAVSAVIFTVWVGLGFANNPIGVLLVAVPLIIFYFCTPKFEKIYPLKKYKKSMEAAKAAREYGGEMKFKKNIGNNINNEEPNISTPVFETEKNFSINEDIFTSIKSNRKKPVVSGSKPTTGFQPIIDTNKTDSEEYVPIIENSKVSHISSSENVPLHKIHKEKPSYSENISEDIDEINFSENKKAETNEKRKKQEGLKYSANRRF